MNLDAISREKGGKRTCHSFACQQKLQQDPRERRLAGSTGLEPDSRYFSKFVMARDFWV
jgi:hypothetical protein